MYFPREEERRIFQLLDSKEAVALIGPRRAGKTTIAQRLLDDWKRNGGQGEYFDLEALGAPSTANELVTRISQLPKNSLVVLDEIQVLTDWVKVVRGEVENNARKVLVTGSSATLLSKEIASSLGGRAIPETVLPISYRDARLWKIDSLEEYLRIGGYPECVLRPADAARLHKLYLELTILRDVAARKGIREIKPLTDLAVLLLSECGKSISAKKTSAMLGISQPTFRSFVQALNDAFLILSVPPYLRSPRERIVADAKHYAYDTGLQNSVTVSTQDDHGRKFENIVAVELVRRGYSLSYLKNDAECDFIASKIGEENLAIQVWSGEGKLPQRELDGLELGIKVGRARGLILSSKRIGKIENIEIKTIEEWLLDYK